MMGIANNGHLIRWVPRRMVLRAMGPWMASAAGDMATYAMDWRFRHSRELEMNLKILLSKDLLALTLFKIQ